MTYKNRGMLLEGLINKTILMYRENGLALIHKKDLSISFSSISKEDGKLKADNAFIKKKSTADYYGLVKGKFICFEAKSTKLDYLPWNNIKEHQHEYLLEVSEHGGIAFYLIYLSSWNEVFLLDVNKVEKNCKKITREFLLNRASKLEITYPGIIDFIHLIK